MNITVQDMQHRVAAHLSTAARVGYTTVALAAAAMATLTGALAATEPDLPRRTYVALVVMCAIGIGWAALALWVLQRRRVLLAQHRVVVTGFASIVSTLFLVGAFALQSPMRRPTMAVAGAMCVLAISAWFQARRVRARLMARRDALMREIQ